MSKRERLSTIRVSTRAIPFKVSLPCGHDHVIEHTAGDRWVICDVHNRSFIINAQMPFEVDVSVDEDDFKRSDGWGNETVYRKGVKQ